MEDKLFLGCLKNGSFPIINEGIYLALDQPLVQIHFILFHFLVEGEGCIGEFSGDKDILEFLTDLKDDEKKLDNLIIS